MAPVDPSLVVFAAGPTSSLAATYDMPNGWTTTSLAGGTAHVAASSGTAEAVGLTVQLADNALQFSTGPAAWTPLAGIAPGVTAQGIGAAPAPSGGHHVVFHGIDFMFYYAEFGLGVWAPTAEPIQPPAQAQSFGPFVPTIAVLAGNPIIAFTGNDGMLYIQPRNGSVWQAAKSVAGAQLALQPSLVALTSGAELLSVWVHDAPGQFDDKKLFWAMRTAGQWSAPAKMSDSIFTDSKPSLAALDGGEALVAFKGTDGKGYSTQFTPSANPPWSSAVPIAASVDIKTTPAVSRGDGTADAELVYLDMAGAVHHSRWISGMWGATQLVGGSGLTDVTIAR